MLKPANLAGARDYRAFRNPNASNNDPYTLARLAADGDAVEHARRFRDTGEWIMEMNAVSPREESSDGGRCPRVEGL